jgi:hypothetical protein
MVDCSVPPAGSLSVREDAIALLDNTGPSSWTVGGGIVEAAPTANNKWRDFKGLMPEAHG